MTLYMVRIIPSVTGKYILPNNVKHPDSDTIFGALVSVWRMLGNSSINDLVNNIVISSAFPVINIKEEEIFFLPMSNYILEKFSQNDDSMYNKIKKAQYVSFSLYMHTSDNIIKNSEMFGDFLLNKNEADRIKELLDQGAENKVKKHGFITRAEIARNTVDRLSQASSLYYQQYIQPLFTDRIKTHYWMLIDNNYIDEEQLAVTLKLMGENGIGGERTLGYGKSKILIEKPLQWMETSYSVIKNKNKQLLISLLYDDKKIILEQIKKELSISGIIVKRRFLKKQFIEIGFIREGTTNRERISGKIIRTQTEPNKLFNGKGFWISIPL